MKIEQAYIEYLMLVNRNASSNNINVDKPRFIIAFNDISQKYVEWLLEKRNEDSIRNISNLLIPDKILTKYSEGSSSESYKLPKDYFDFANLQVLIGKGECKNQRALTTEVKSEDTEELFADENNVPHFEFREVSYFLTNGNVKVFKSDFRIDQVKLTYYRTPKKADIAGYTDYVTKQPSQNIDPDFSEKSVRRILLGMAKQFALSNTDSAKYTMAKDALFSEI